jgi:hypothetical protein
MHDSFYERHASLKHKRARGANCTLTWLERMRMSNCLHPGVIKTKLLQAGLGDYPCNPPKKGARTSVYLASSPDVERVSGEYSIDCRLQSSRHLATIRIAEEILGPG